LVFVYFGLFIRCLFSVSFFPFFLSAEILDRTRRQLMAVAASSRERLGAEDGIPVVTGLAAFEAPPG